MDDAGGISDVPYKRHVNNNPPMKRNTYLTEHFPGEEVRMLNTNHGKIRSIDRLWECSQPRPQGPPREKRNATNLEYRTIFLYGSENFFCFVLQIGCIPILSWFSMI